MRLKEAFGALLNQKVADVGVNWIVDEHDALSGLEDLPNLFQSISNFLHTMFGMN